VEQLKVAIMAGMFGAMVAAATGINALADKLDRCANALNESNRIMVGVENGTPANPGNFHKADPSRSF